MKINARIFFAVAVFWSNFAFAQSPAEKAGTPQPAAPTAKRYAQAGVFELAGTAGVAVTSIAFTSGTTSNAAGTVTQISLAPTFSHYIINSFALGVTGQFVSYIDSGLAATSLAAYFSPGYTFDLKSDLFIYVNGLIGFASISSGGSSSQSGVGYGARSGLKISISERTLIDVGLQYLVQNYSLSGSGGTTSTSSYKYTYGTFATTVGFSIWF